MLFGFSADEVDVEKNGNAAPQHTEESPGVSEAERRGSTVVLNYIKTEIYFNGPDTVSH